MVLLVPEKLMAEKNTRTAVLMATICNAWPMLIFIIVSACLSGLVVWVLDKEANAEEFPPTFFTGAWEGIWWAFVTMTTVGYGDVAPKSAYARFFCVLWILMGLIMISLFTGLISAALSASATPVFVVSGSKIGAVSGSLEFQIGVELNAEMYAYPNHPKMMDDLYTGHKLHGILIDNFILTALQKEGFLSKPGKEVRSEREFPYPITYGIAMRHGSESTASCFRKYTRVFTHKIFEVISSKLIPVKNPTDQVSLEVKAAEKLFYDEKGFKTLVYVEVGLLMCALVAGVVWEYFLRNRNNAAYILVAAARGKSKLARDNYAIGDNQAMGGQRPIDILKKSSMITDQTGKHSISSGMSAMDNLGPAETDDLISEYELFHKRWITKLKAKAAQNKREKEKQEEAKKQENDNEGGQHHEASNNSNHSNSTKSSSQRLDMEADDVGLIHIDRVDTVDMNGAQVHMSRVPPSTILPSYEQNGKFPGNNKMPVTAGHNNNHHAPQQQPPRNQQPVADQQRPITPQQQQQQQKPRKPLDPMDDFTSQISDFQGQNKAAHRFHPQQPAMPVENGNSRSTVIGLVDLERGASNGSLNF